MTIMKRTGRTGVKKTERKTIKGNTGIEVAAKAATRRIPVNSEKRVPPRSRTIASTSTGNSKTNKAASRAPHSFERGALRTAIPPSLLLDWSRFEKGDNHRRFEDLALDLFARVHGEKGFIPNVIRGGRDGGADGIFEGTIGKVSGKWKVAAALRSDFASVKSKIKHENQGARDQSFIGLIFITSWDGPPNEVAQAQGVAKVGLRDALVWSRRKIERLLRSEPWLRQQYFGHLLIPGFVAPDSLEAVDDRSQPDLSLIGREAQVQALRAFATGKPRIMVLVAQGGAGKSRMLRELPGVTRGIVPMRTAWIRRADQGSIEEGLRSGLPSAWPTIVALDDAASFIHEVREFARLATDGVIDCKVVLAIRPSDKPEIEQVLGGLRQAVVWLELGPMEHSDLVHLATAECPGLALSDAKRLARYFGSNLFLLRAAAQLVHEGKPPRLVVEDGYLRGRIAGRLISESIQALCSTQQPQVLRLLLSICLDTPLPTTNSSEDLIALLEARILRQVGRTLRFRSDVEGDVLLTYLLVNYPALRAAARALLASNEGQLIARLRNLSMAGEGHAASLVRELVTEWEQDPRRTPSDIWRLLALCARAAPSEVSSLAERLIGIRAPNEDEVVDVVAAVGRGSSARGIKLADELLARTTFTSDIARFVGRLRDYLLNPVFHGPEELQEVCETLLEWMNSPLTVPRSSLIAEALCAMLATLVRWQSSDAATFTLREWALPATPPFLSLRKSALVVLESMLVHTDRHARLDALAVLSKHGEPSFGVDVSQEPMKGEEDSEFSTMIPTLRRLLDEECDLALRVEMHGQLFTRWVTGRPGSEICAVLLRGHAWEPLAKAYQFSAGWDWFFSFDEVLAEAPLSNEERWSWWCERRLTDEPVRALNRVVASVNESALSIEDARSMIHALASAPHPLTILEPWCRLQPEVFQEVALGCSEPRVQSLLEKCLRRHSYAVDPQQLFRDLEALPQPAQVDQISSLLDDIQQRSSADSLRLARYLVLHPEIAVRQAGLKVISTWGKISATEAVSLLQDALRDGVWDGHWDAVQWLVSQHAEELRSHPALRKLLTDRLVDTESGFGIKTWHVNQLLDIACAGEFESLMDVLGEVVIRRSFKLAHMVGHLLARVVISSERLSLLLGRLVLWCEELPDHRERVVEYVLSSCLNDAAREKPDHTQAVLSELLEPCQRLLLGGRPNQKLVATIALSLMDHSAVACAALADFAALEGPMQAFAQSRLSCFRFPRGITSRIIGSPSSQLVALRKMLRDADGLAGSGGKSAIADIRAYVESQMRSDANSDAEELDPR